MHITDITFATYGRKVSVNRVFPARDSGINKLYYINNGAILCKTPSEEYV